MSEERSEERQEEVFFRGHVEECLRHFGTALNSRAPKGSRGAAQVRKPMADFCGVVVPSVTRWLNCTGPLPIGEILIKMMCFLDMVGYRVIELERMPRVQRNFAELIGFGFISSEEAAKSLGYSSASTLYQVFKGNQGVSSEKRQNMWGMWKGRKEELEQRKRQLLEAYHLSISPESFQKLESEGPAVLLQGQLVVVKIIEVLLLLLKEYPLGGFSEDDFANLRNHSDMILELSALLKVLGSKLTLNEEKGGG